MNTCDTIESVEAVELESLAVKDENVVHMPLGLLGFESIKHYALLQNKHESPFRWMQVIDQPNLAFLVLPALEVFPDYEPDVPAEDVKFLGLTSPDDALVFNIVTLLPPRAQYRESQRVRSSSIVSPSKANRWSRYERCAIFDQTPSAAEPLIKHQEQSIHGRTC